MNKKKIRLNYDLASISGINKFNFYKFQIKLNGDKNSNHGFVLVKFITENVKSE